MLGKDVERMLGGIEAVKNAAVSAIDSLSSATAYRITTNVVHQEEPVLAGGFTSGISSSISGMSGDYGKMNSMGNSLYANPNSFNNSCGSPWTELTQLNKAVNDAVSFESSHPQLPWMGEKAALLSMINKVLSSAIDARWALMHFHDHIQRGYDHKYNGDVPSYTWAGANNQQTTGNIRHDYKDNVHIPKAPVESF